MSKEFPTNRFFDNRKITPVFITSRIGLLLVVLALHINQANGQSCDPGTTSFPVDLSSSATASWSSPSSFTFNGQCCGVPSNHNCMELLIHLHPQANGVSIVFNVPTGSVYYKVNCGPSQSASNIVNICFNKGDVGPHSVVFCRNGFPSYDFTVFSTTNGIDVDLAPFTPVCITGSDIVLSGGTPPGGVYYVNNNATPLFDVAANGPGDHEITYQYQDPNSGCIAFATQTLKVVPLPTITWVTEEFCNANGWVPLNGASPPGGYYTGNFVVDNKFNVSSVIEGNYQIHYTYSDPYGCTSTSAGSIFINDLPLANAGNDTVVITGNIAMLSASIGGPDTYSYSWEPAALVVNPNVRNTQTINIFQSTTFTLTVTNLVTGCVATDQKLVKVTGGDLHISEIISSPATICVGDSAQLWVLPGGGSGSYNYMWTPNPPDLSFNHLEPSPWVSPVTTTDYTVVITDAINPFADPITATVTLTVNPLPIVGLNHPDPFVCANTPKYSLKGGTPANGRYFMEDEHEGYLHLPYINFSNFLPDKIGEGNYFIAYEYTDPATGCSATAKKPFEIRPYLRAQFYTSREDICLSNEISIANHTVPATGIQYQWEFGDGTTSTETTPKFKHNFPENDNITDYTIKLTATNLVSTCVSTQQRNVRVFPSVVSKFRAEPDSLGCSDLSVNFFTESTGPILFHFWDFDDGTFSVENNPSKTFANHSDTVRIYNVILTVMSTNYFCTSSDTIPITVYPAISAGFTVNPVQGCHPLEIEVGNLARGATDYYWDFGNGTFSTDSIPANPIYHNTTSDTLHFTIT